MDNPASAASGPASHLRPRCTRGLGQAASTTGNSRPACSTSSCRGCRGFRVYRRGTARSGRRPTIRGLAPADFDTVQHHGSVGSGLPGGGGYTVSACTNIKPAGSAARPTTSSPSPRTTEQIRALERRRPQRQRRPRVGLLLQGGVKLGAWTPTTARSLTRSRNRTPTGLRRTAMSTAAVPDLR